MKEYQKRNIKIQIKDIGSNNTVQPKNYYTKKRS